MLQLIQVHLHFAVKIEKYILLAQTSLTKHLTKIFVSFVENAYVGKVALKMIFQDIVSLTELARSTFSHEIATNQVQYRPLRRRRLIPPLPVKILAVLAAFDDRGR
jgi:hypothetical protein